LRDDGATGLLLWVLSNIAPQRGQREDQLHHPFGTFWYLRMPKGLRNAGPTFCRMMKAALKDQVDRNILSYVDDIVVASRKKETYISDLARTFANMRKARLKLNPEKCIFRITKGKVLDCLVSKKVLRRTPTKSELSFKCNLRRVGKTFRNLQAE
jgi:hypothetical protein